MTPHIIIPTVMMSAATTESRNDPPAEKDESKTDSTSRRRWHCVQKGPCTPTRCALDTLSESERRAYFTPYAHWMSDLCCCCTGMTTVQREGRWFCPTCETSQTCVQCTRTAIDSRERRKRVKRAWRMHHGVVAAPYTRTPRVVDYPEPTRVSWDLGNLGNLGNLGDLGNLPPRSNGSPLPDGNVVLGADLRRV